LPTVYLAGAAKTRRRAFINGRFRKFFNTYCRNDYSFFSLTFAENSSKPQAERGHPAQKFLACWPPVLHREEARPYNPDA